MAEKLGWKLWDQHLTDHIARQFECDKRQVERREEQSDPLYDRLFKSFLHESFEGNLAAMRGAKFADAETIRQASERLVHAGAEKGNAVIVGRLRLLIFGIGPTRFTFSIYAPCGRARATR